MNLTPLMIAAMENNIEALKVLAQTQDLNAQNNKGNTALMLAIILEQQDAIDFLLDAGADLDIKNVYGETARTLSFTRQVALDR